MEAAEITSISSALVINIGTLNQRTIASMIAAGKQANQNSIPVVFDPVGAGASKLRNEATREILKQVKVTVLREIFLKFLLSQGWMFPQKVWMLPPLTTTVTQLLLQKQ